MDEEQNNEVGNESEEGPLWNFVDIVTKNKGGGNRCWVCKACGIEFQGSYTRVRGHLLKVKGTGIRVCVKVSSQQVQHMTKLEKDYEEKLIGNAPKKVSLPSGPSNFDQFSRSSAAKKRKSENTIQKAFDNNSRQELDCRIARMFYTAGLPFNLARNPYYLSAFTFAANSNLGGYVPPGYNSIITTLLDQEKEHVELSLASIKSTWEATGVTIVSDGWSDPTRRP